MAKANVPFSKQAWKIYEQLTRSFEGIRKRMTVKWRESLDTQSSFVIPVGLNFAISLTSISQVLKQSFNLKSTTWSIVEMSFDFVSIWVIVASCFALCHTLWIHGLRKMYIVCTVNAHCLNFFPPTQGIRVSLRTHYLDFLRCRGFKNLATRWDLIGKCISFHASRFLCSLQKLRTRNWLGFCGSIRSIIFGTQSPKMRIPRIHFGLHFGLHLNFTRGVHNNVFSWPNLVGQYSSSSSCSP